jgi:hypothetical protein
MLAALPFETWVEAFLQLKPGQSPLADDVPSAISLTYNLAIFSIKVAKKIEQELLERIEKLERQFVV